MISRTLIWSLKAWNATIKYHKLRTTRSTSDNAILLGIRTFYWESDRLHLKADAKDAVHTIYW